MSFLEVVQLIGYSTGAFMTLWMCWLLVRRRRLVPVERALIALGVSIGIWHASNLFLVVHDVLGLDRPRWTTALRLADSVAVIAITFSYSFLLHVHLHLWAGARGRDLNPSERARVFLSYLPTVFLAFALREIWIASYSPMLEQFSITTLPIWPHVSFLLAFSIWAVYVLSLVAATDLLISGFVSNRNEKMFFRMLSTSFLAIALLILAYGALGLGSGSELGEFLKTLANLGSLVPAAFIAYYIYRYRYLELIIRDSLVVASFSIVVLVIYLIVVRSFGTWVAARYGLRPAAVEALLILGLALMAAPLRRALDSRFHEVFKREAALYRDVVAKIGNHRGQFRRLPELLHFIETTTAAALGLLQVKIVPLEHDGGDGGDLLQSLYEVGSTERQEHDPKQSWVLKLHSEIHNSDAVRLENSASLDESGFDIAYALRRDDEVVGLMLAAGAPEALTPDVRSVLEVLASQVAIAIDDSRLVKENVRLESEVARGERLSALGQMAATIAHEVKNPLSAIKSIAQVLREDTSLTEAYSRDLNLIVGEADRLNQSVTQLLSFARTGPASSDPRRVEEVLRSVTELYRADANERRIAIMANVCSNSIVEGRVAMALQDALTNLVLNALQSTPPGMPIWVEAREDGPELVVSVEDSGAGIPRDLAGKIWEPFFTTKQRGTGLGLAIVRRRMEEIGGLARLVSPLNGQGARFELRLPKVV
jgi:signal transduction histidine kinase